MSGKAIILQPLRASLLKSYKLLLYIASLSGKILENYCTRF